MTRARCATTVATVCGAGTLAVDLLWRDVQGRHQIEQESDSETKKRNSDELC